MKIYSFLLAIALFTISCDAEKPIQKKHFETKVTNNDSLLTIVAVGDVMLGSNFPSNSFLSKTPNLLMNLAKEEIFSADIAFCNLEGCLLDSGGVRKSCDDTLHCYTFRQPVSTATVLKDYGFDLISIANNHTNDFGQIGLNSTKVTLSKVNMKFAGLPSKSFDTLTVKGILIGFTAFSANEYTLNINDYVELEKQVRYLKSICKIVVVSFHGGAEGNSKRHIPMETEMFLGENRGNVYDFAHKAIDFGADLVLGHGPHVIRAAELYKNKFIAYSLGNFCTYGTFNLSGHCGNSLLLEISLTKNGDFVSAKANSYEQKKYKPLQMDKSQKAFNDLKELSTQDFPNSNLIFLNDGIIKKK